MPDLSKHYAIVNFDAFYPYESSTVEPISVQVTVDETWSPYCQATVVLHSEDVPIWLDPRSPMFVGLRLQQDFGDLVYVREITADYAGDVSNITAALGGKVSNFTRKYSAPWNIFEPALPLSTVTTAYAPVKPLKLTNAGLNTVWKMSDFLHGSGTFNPQPSTVFDGTLMLRSIEKDYASGETTLKLASNEAILQDSIGFPGDFFFSFTKLRDIINYVLNESISYSTFLEPGAADYTYSPAYTLFWRPNQSGWDILNALVTAAGLVLYCDEQQKWYLLPATATSGTLELTDQDNITALTYKIDRDSPNFFNSAIVEYTYPGTLTSYDGYDGAYPTRISKDAYFLRENIKSPGNGAAESLVNRAMTRGETYSIEALNNYNARPRQEMTMDITGETIKSAVIQSISWSLPSARMSVDIRDLQEVI